MNEINIANLLKDCPKGYKLYSCISGNVRLEKVEDNGVIQIISDNGIISYYDEYGRYILESEIGECVLWPSKEHRIWDYIKYEPIVLANVGDTVEIIKQSESSTTSEFGIVISIANQFSIDNCISFNVYNPIKKTYKTFYSNEISLLDNLQIKSFNKELHKQNLHYSKTKKRLVQWINPFDKVLVRDYDNEVWDVNLFSRYMPHLLASYMCINRNYKQCIPYEGNEHLLGTKSNNE